MITCPVAVIIGETPSPWNRRPNTAPNPCPEKRALRRQNPAVARCQFGAEHHRDTGTACQDTAKTGRAHLLVAGQKMRHHHR